MRKIRYLTLLMFAMLCCVGAVAQDGFDPANPADPGVPPQKLILVAQPYEAGSVSGGGKFVPEARTQVTAYCNTNWVFVGWTDDSDEVVSTERSFYYTKQDKAETLTAHFEFSPGSPADPQPGTQLVYYKLTVQAGQGGSASGGGKYQAGTSVGLRAYPDTGWKFAGWVNEEGDTLSTSTYFDYVTKEFAETLTATFSYNPGSPDEPGNPILRKKLHVLVYDDGGTVNGGGTFMSGTSVYLSAYPNTGYRFVGWYRCDELYTTLRSFNYTVSLDECNTFEARFEFDPASPADPDMPLDGRYSLYWISPITYPGKDVSCRLFLSNLAPLGDMHFDLTFPEGLVPDVPSIQLSDAMAGYTASVTATDSPETYTVTLHGGTISAGNQEILSIPVVVPDTTATNTNYQLKINQVSVSQEDGTTCTMRTRNGRISVYKLGDSNGDGEVNILDCINMVQRIHNNGETGAGSTFIEEVSDLNEDGDIDVMDIIGVIDIIK